MNFSLPFSITSTGSVTTTSDPNQVASDRMESLVGTYTGERIMLPDYGVPIPAILFANQSAAEQSLIQLQVQQAIAKWEPTLVLNSVDVSFSTTSEGVTGISVNFSISSNPASTPVQTVVIEVGGNVITG